MASSARRGPVSADNRWPRRHVGYDRDPGRDDRCGPATAVSRTQRAFEERRVNGAHRFPVRRGRRCLRIAHCREPAIVVGHEPPPAPVQTPEHTPERHSRLRLLIDSAQTVEAEPPPLVATDEPSHHVTEIAVLDTVAADPAAGGPEPIASGPQPAAEALDTEILAFFVEEASELLSAIGSGLRAWRANPSDNGASQQLLRVLHNFKGSAHTVGAVHLCRLAHDMEGPRGSPGGPRRCTSLRCPQCPR